MAERVGYLPSPFCYHIMFSATCLCLTQDDAVALLSALTHALIVSACRHNFRHSVISLKETRPKSPGFPLCVHLRTPRTIDQRQSESTNYKPDYMSFYSEKSCLYRFGSSVMRRSACAKACDPMMKSASKRLGPCCAVLRRRFAYRANRRPASSHTRC